MLSSDITDPYSSLRELSADPARQAVSTIRGYIYQVWWSVDAWLQLQSVDEVIYLEGAEDLDKVGADEATAGQIKHEAASISLNNKRAHEALENFWALSEREPNRHVDFHYMTTASAATERDGVFGDVCGVEAWRVAQTRLDMAGVIQTYLAEKLPATSSLRAFLASAEAGQVQARLIRRFHWFLNQPGVADVKLSVDDRLTARLSAKNIPLSYLERVRNHLYSFTWDTLVKPESHKRRLTVADLLRQVDAATTEHLPVTARQYQQFVEALHAGAFDPGGVLLKLMRLPVPEVPSPLLARPQLVGNVRRLVDERKAVLLTGTVFKGKTTLAQLVATELCPDAWWFPVSARSGTETDNLLRALAAVVDQESAPAVIVVDDLDLSTAAHSAYRHSLALVVNRAGRVGRGLLLTARGASSTAAQLSDFSGIEVVDVPEMSREEVQDHCVNNGCSERLSPAWGALIHGLTHGHPKLIQVRIAELASSNWPPLSPDVITQSTALASAKQAARLLLAESVKPETAEFVYTAAEASVPMTRLMLQGLLHAIDGAANEGDVIDSLRGKWLESVADRLRVTPMLQGSAAEVWLPEKRQLAHRRIYDAIFGVRKLDTYDGAALLFHAFIAQDEARLMHCVRVLEGIDERTVSSAVFQQLLWLPIVALAPGQRFFDGHAFVSVLLRQLQFSVASEVDSDSLATIFDRWKEEVVAVQNEGAREAMEVLLWSKVLTTRSSKISLRTKLSAISSLSRLSGEAASVAEQGMQRVIAMSLSSPGGIPEEATTSQFHLSLQASAVRSLDDLSSVLDWLEHDASEELRGDFEKVLGWPLVASVGAYVHGAWSARHAEETDWAPTIAALDRAATVARRFSLTRFGSEVAKATSIVYGEHMGDHAAAMKVLDDATTAFGDSPAIREQRVNALFQVKDDALALEFWEQLATDGEASKYLDAFAYRRAGISACRLGRWAKAEKYFLAGAATQPELRLALTAFGLVADASYVAALGGAPQRAARMFSDMVLELPEIASEDGHDDWDALLRVVSSVCHFIEAVVNGEDTTERRLGFGRGSEPGLSFGPAQPKQALRTELAIGQVGMLASQLGSVSNAYRQRLNMLGASHFPLVRFLSARALLSFEFNAGTTEDFVETLAAFDRAFNVIGSLEDRSNAMQGDGGNTEPTQVKTVEDGWFSALSAAAICCDRPLQCVAHWEAAASMKWGTKSQTAADLADVAKGLVMSNADAWAVVRAQVARTRGETLGAALMLLNASNHRPTTVFHLQLVLVSATVSHPQGLILQETFARPIARRFAMQWKQLANSPFLFTSPKESVPALVKAVAAAEEGCASVKPLLAEAARVVGATLGEVETRLQ